MSQFERRVPNEVEAVQLKEAIYNASGGKLADAGEWLLTDGFGQYYMKDADFQREFIRRGPQVKTVIQKEVQFQPITVTSRPIIIKEPCPDYWRWPRPWWDRGIVWMSNSGYNSCHLDDGGKITSQT